MPTVAAADLAALLAAVLRRYPYRGKTFLWRQVEARLEGRTREVPFPGGGRMAIDTRSYWQRQMAALCYERATAWILPRLLAPGDVFIDAGANCGYYSCLAAGAVGSAGRVLAFEPNPRLLPQLLRQRTLNGDRITVVPRAVSDGEGTAKLFMQPGEDRAGWKSGLSSLQAQDGWTRVDVGTTSLDGYLEDHAIPHVQLAKIDIEGHEHAALEGAARSLESGAIESVLVEVNDRRSADLLLTYRWDFMLHPARRWAQADPRVLGAGQSDVLCLRGSGSARWRALKARSRFV